MYTGGCYRAPARHVTPVAHFRCTNYDLGVRSFDASRGAVFQSICPSGIAAVGLRRRLGLPPCRAGPDDAVYNAGASQEILTTATGVVYVGLVAYLLFKVFTRRAQRFRSEKLSSSLRDGEPSNDEADDADPELQPEKLVTAGEAALGAVQALGFAGLLYLFTTKIDALVLTAPLPDQYTARNIAITVRTIIRGLFYLVTFIFAANGVGLSALCLKIFIFGDETAPALPKPDAKKDILSTISITSNPEDVKRALDQVSDIERYRKKAESTQKD